VGYKTPGGIQNVRWDTKRPVGYKTSGRIQEPWRDLGFLEEKSHSI
jgi:hypothetical protein